VTFFVIWENEGLGGGETRYARPWRPVKPLLTICDAKAISVEQWAHLIILGCTRDNRSALGALITVEEPRGGRLLMSWQRLGEGEMGRGVAGDELGHVEMDEMGDELRDGTASAEMVLDIDCCRRRSEKGEEKVMDGRR